MPVEDDSKARKKNSKLLYLNYSTFYIPSPSLLSCLRSLAVFFYSWHKTHNNSMNIFGDKFISLSYEKINFIYYYFFSFILLHFSFKQVSGNDDDDIYSREKLIPVSVTLMFFFLQNGFFGLCEGEENIFNR